MEQEFVISVKGLTKKFGDFVATNAITFDVHKGEIFGFLGANGAGISKKYGLYPSSGKSLGGDEKMRRASSLRRGGNETLSRCR